MSIWLKRCLYISGLLLVIGATLMITMPVQFMVIQRGLPETVRIGAVSGTLQSGRVSNFVYNRQFGRMDLREFPLDVSWEWCPGWSQGVLSWCVGIESSLVKGRGHVSYALLAGEYQLYDTVFRLHVQGYPVDLKGVRSELQGTGFIKLKELSFDPRRVLFRKLAAEGEWDKLATPEFELGNYLWRANLETGGILTSDFSGGREDFQVKGRASLDPAKRTYRYAVDVTSKSGMLLAVLKNQASKSKNNTLTFSNSGKF